MSGGTALEPFVHEGVVPYPAEFAERYRAAGYWTGQTHSDMLFESVERFPQKVAIIAGEERITYAELGDRVLRAAAGLQEKGIRRGDRVVVHLPNIPAYIVLVFALFELGAVPVFALAAHRRNEIAYFIAHLDGTSLRACGSRTCRPPANRSPRVRLRKPRRCRESPRIRARWVRSLS